MDVRFVGGPMDGYVFKNWEPAEGETVTMEASDPRFNGIYEVTGEVTEGTDGAGLAVLKWRYGGA